MPHPSQTAQHTPHKPAIIMGNSGEVVSYRELDERSNRAAQLFRSLGLVKGDHIGLMLDNRREFLEICVGAQRAGLIYTPISTHLREEETAYILGNCGARAFIVAHDLAEVAARMLDAAFSVQHFFMLGGVVDGFEPLEEALERQPATPIDDQANGVPMLTPPAPPASPRACSWPRPPMTCWRPILWRRPSAPRSGSARRRSTCRRRRSTTRRRCTTT
jgi:long-chain acyl-CoA synthetase